MTYTVSDVLLSFGEVAVPALTAALENSAIGEIIIEILGQIGGDAAFNALVHAATHQNADVRLAVVQAFGALGDAAAQTQLATMRDHDPNPQVSSMAAMFLRRRSS